MVGRSFTSPGSCSSSPPFLIAASSSAQVSVQNKDANLGHQAKGNSRLSLFVLWTDLSLYSGSAQQLPWVHSKKCCRGTVAESYRLLLASTWRNGSRISCTFPRLSTKYRRTKSKGRSGRVPAPAPCRISHWKTRNLKLAPIRYPLCLMCITSPSFTMYSLPSRRSVPRARASASEPASSN